MKYLFAFFILIISGFLYAQGGLSYQAVVRNTNGQINTNANVFLQFSVLDGSSSGTILYREKQTLISDAYGWISTSVGTGTLVSGNLSTINWGSGDKILLVECSSTANGTYTSLGNSVINPVSLRGMQGVAGPQGIQGLQGIAGAAGATGATGLTGLQGLKGDKGDPGTAGIQGMKGDPGIQGIQGIKGEKGDTGAVGPQGVAGPQGPSGGALSSILYTGGWENNGTKNVAKIWKDGVSTSLTDGTLTAIVNSIFVQGTDVYATGYEFNSTVSVAKVWKNGVPSILSDGTKTAVGNFIFLSGTDVYVAGFENSAAGVQIAKIWKNGIASSLSNATLAANALGVFVSGPDVYVAGYESNGTKFVAKVWKNGLATTLSDGINHSNAKSVLVVGADVYVAGYESNSTVQVAKVWKNGIATALTDGTKTADAYSVFVNGTDVYASGYESNGTKIVAKYWKNGVGIALSDGTKDETAKKMFVTGTDVYVSGAEFGTISKAKIWKNGVATTYTDATKNAEMTSVFVVTSSVGVVGPIGPQGIQGVPGPQGIQGIAGPQGLPGPTGAAGPTGPIGATGAAGLNAADNQTLSIIGNTLSIRNGNSITLPLVSGSGLWNNNLLATTIAHNIPEIKQVLISPEPGSIALADNTTFTVAAQNATSIASFVTNNTAANSKAVKISIQGTASTFTNPTALFIENNPFLDSGVGIKVKAGGTGIDIEGGLTGINVKSSNLGPAGSFMGGTGVIASGQSAGVSASGLFSGNETTGIIGTYSGNGSFDGKGVVGSSLPTGATIPNGRGFGIGGKFTGGNKGIWSEMNPNPSSNYLSDLRIYSKYYTDDLLPMAGYFKSKSAIGLTSISEGNFQHIDGNAYSIGIVGRSLSTGTNSTSIGIYGEGEGQGTRVGVMGNAEGTGVAQLNIGVKGIAKGDLGIAADFRAAEGINVEATRVGLVVQAPTNVFQGSSTTEPIVKLSHLSLTGGTALQIDNGYIKVNQGSTAKTAYIHTTAASNIVANRTNLNYSNMASTDMLIVTHNFRSQYMPLSVGVWWNGSAWTIFLESSSGSVMPIGEAFNVLIIKQ